MEQKHLGGGWEVVEVGGMTIGVGKVVDNVEESPIWEMICHVVQTGCALQAEKADAYAKLIAAAPSLLEACKFALESLTSVHIGGGAAEAGEFERVLRAAIARAEGGEGTGEKP